MPGDSNISFQRSLCHCLRSHLRSEAPPIDSATHTAYLTSIFTLGASASQHCSIDNLTYHIFDIIISGSSRAILTMMRLAGYTMLSTQMAGTALLLLVLLAAHDAPLATASGSHASARKLRFSWPGFGPYFPAPAPSPDYSTGDCCFVNGVLDCRREVCNPSRPRPFPRPRPRPPRPRPDGDQISRQCASQGEDMADIAKDAACARLNRKCRRPSDFLPSYYSQLTFGYDIDEPQPAPRGISDACRSLMESACVQAAMARVTGDCRAFLEGWSDCADQTINPLYSFRSSLEDDFCVV